MPDDKPDKIAEAMEPIERPVKLTELKSHIKKIKDARAEAESGATARASAFKAAGEDGFNRKAVGDGLRIERMSPGQRADYFRTLDAMIVALELRPEPDMLDKAGVGDDAIKRASAAAAKDKAEKAEPKAKRERKGKNGNGAKAKPASDEAKPAAGYDVKSPPSLPGKGAADEGASATQH